MQNLVQSKNVSEKLIFQDFYTVKTWEIKEVNGTDLANSFIMCGVLYGLASGTWRDTVINFAYDLYEERLLNVNVKWYNPYQANTMLDYNPVDSRLYFYDARFRISCITYSTWIAEHYWADWELATKTCSLKEPYLISNDGIRLIASGFSE